VALLQTVTIAIDVMGGDFGPRATVPAAAQCLADYPEICILLVGDENAIRLHLGKLPQHQQDRIQVIHSSEIVTMDEKPVHALRNKKQSSMYLAIDAVAQGNADACVSAGNTGALMVLSRSLLGMHEGIDRPAFIREIPTLTGHCHVLDLGANVGCDAQHLYQFGVMGSIVARVVDKNPNPRVGLLNVGQEASKGIEQVKEAARLLQGNSQINYIGFVEGDHIFADAADVIVCDGFVGNVALKTSEGLAKMVSLLLTQNFHQNMYTKLVGMLSKPVLNRLVKQIDPKRHNGASLLGLQGTLVKSHGNADVAAYKQAIRRAIHEATSCLPQLIQKDISEINI